MRDFSDIHFSILGLLAECGCVSRQTFNLMDYSYNYLTRSLKTLLDTSLVRLYGKGQNKYYTLTNAGRVYMEQHNPTRFCSDIIKLNRQLTKHPERSVLRGDVSAMFLLAGYAVHPDDKPTLPAFTPPLLQPQDYQHWKFLCQSVAKHTYPSGTDQRKYSRRLTAIGAYYDAATIKGLLLQNSDKDKEGLNYSRACGVVMTPDCLFRVFHSRDVAMKLKMTGEANFKSLLFSDKVYSGFVPDNRDAVLVFGRDFSAVRLIIEHNLYGHKSNLPYYVKHSNKKGAFETMKGTAGELLSPTNLGTPSYYLPLSTDGLELLPLFQYPHWTDILHQHINRRIFGIENQSKWAYELDGRAVYVLASLNLQQISMAFRTIKDNPERPVAIACLGWQLSLFGDLLLPYKNQDIIIKRLPPDFMDEVATNLYDYWR